MIARRRTLGAVLAGGQSTRFGTDKAVALWRGRPLIDHASAALARHCDAIIVCGRPDASGFMIADRPAADMGPLGGLNAALHYAMEHGFGRVVTCGCDTPVLPEGLISQLAGWQEPRFVVDLPVIGGWPSDLAPLLDAWLARSEDRSMRGWAKLIGALPITAPPIANVNTPDDLATLDKTTGPISDPAAVVEVMASRLVKS